VDRDNGRGVIEKVAWDVKSANDAVSKLGAKATVVSASDDGFFFPGFIGKSKHDRSRKGEAESS
jgi:hypothetical protein